MVAVGLFQALNKLSFLFVCLKIKNKNKIEIYKTYFVVFLLSGDFFSLETSRRQRQRLYDRIDRFDKSIDGM